jgi:hypothetical protein
VFHFVDGLAPRALSLYLFISPFPFFFLFSFSFSFFFFPAVLPCRVIWVLSPCFVQCAAAVRFGGSMSVNSRVSGTRFIPTRYSRFRAFTCHSFCVPATLLVSLLDPRVPSCSPPAMWTLMPDPGVAERLRRHRGIRRGFLTDRLQATERREMAIRLSLPRLEAIQCRLRGG